MSVTIAELAQAREVANGLLDELDLPAYLFEVEPLSDNQWELRLEFQVDDGSVWETISFPVSKETLLSSQSE